MTEATIFDKIISGEVKSWKVWEDEHYLAFLNIFTIHPGETVVIPKKNPGDYLFTIEDDIYYGLLDAARKVAKILEKGMGVDRVGMVVHGTGVAHAHIRLTPMTADFSGHLSSEDGEKVSDEELDAVQAKIVGAA